MKDLKVCLVFVAAILALIAVASGTIILIDQYRTPSAKLVGLLLGLVGIVIVLAHPRLMTWADGKER